MQDQAGGDSNCPKKWVASSLTVTVNHSLSGTTTLRPRCGSLGQMANLWTLRRRIVLLSIARHCSLVHRYKAVQVTDTATRIAVPSLQKLMIKQWRSHMIGAPNYSIRRLRMIKWGERAVRPLIRSMRNLNKANQLRQKHSYQRPASFPLAVPNLNVSQLRSVHSHLNGWSRY